MKLEDVIAMPRVDDPFAEDQGLFPAPVKNTFVHFELPAPPLPFNIQRLHTCPAEVGMSYLFEKIGRSPVSITSAVGSRCPTPKFTEQAAEQAIEQASEQVIELPMTAVTEDNEVVLGEFFAVKKGKKRLATMKQMAPKQLQQQKQHLQQPQQQQQPGIIASQFKEKVTTCEEEEVKEKELLTLSKTSSDCMDDEARPCTTTEKTAALKDEEESVSEAVAEEWLVPAHTTQEEQVKPLPKAAEEKARITNSTWVDLEDSDVEEAVVRSKRLRWADIEGSDDEKDTKKLSDPAPEVQKGARGQRPLLSRPGREARVRQAQADAEEICSFDFDAVDPSSQTGLTGRMLVMLKSLAQTVIFWEDEGEENSKRLEEKFQLLGLEEDDMYAIGKRIRRAEKKIEERNYREAFDQMSEARRWLQDPEWAEKERARRAERAATRKEEPKEEKQKKKKMHDDVSKKREEEETATAAAVVVAEEEEEWQVVGATTSRTAEKKKKWKQLENEQRCARGGETSSRMMNSSSVVQKQQQASMPPGGKCPQQRQQVHTTAPQRGPPRSLTLTERCSAPPRMSPNPPDGATVATRESRAAQEAAREGGGTKFLCRFTVGIEAEVKGGFRVCRRIFGPGGENMKTTARECNAKLRLRGRGSGFKEGPQMQEADEPLMLCVSTEDREGYEMAIRQVTKLFDKIYDDYEAHCKKHGLPEAKYPRPSVRLQEHPGNPGC